MKILVIDDNLSNRESAIQTLGNSHELTVIGNHNKADGLICYSPLNDEEKVLPYWDVVLCDLMLPAGDRKQGNGMQYVGKEMPIGWAFAINAALNGAKYVAVVTDMDHHDHPASALLDGMYFQTFMINETRALFTNHVKKVGIKGTENGACTSCNGKENDCWKCNGSGYEYKKRGKDWAKILDQLLNNIGEIKAKPSKPRIS